MTKKRRKRPQILVTIVVFLLSFIFIYPMWECLVISFSPLEYVVSSGFKFFPPSITFNSYEKVFESGAIFIGYKNTLWRAFVGTVLTLALTYCGAYALRNSRMPGYKVISFLILFTMYFSGGLVPSYINIKSLGLLNNMWVFVLPGAVGAYNLLVMRSFLKGLGTELEEAARIDGASYVQTMVRIYLPLSKAILAVVGLWSVVGHWNSYMDGMIYAPKREFLLLQNAIRELTISMEQETISGSGLLMSLSDMTPESVKAATVICATAPILAGYPFVQKYLVEGTMVGSIKG